MRPTRERARAINPDALREITGPSGGYTEIVRTAADLGPATARIADELNKQYTLAYSSSRPPDDTWRNIRVRITRGDYWRDRVAPISPNAIRVRRTRNPKSKT